MLFEHVIERLSLKYDITVIDLSPYFINGDLWLHNAIKKIHKEYYNPNEKIVFHFSRDQYLYYDSIGTLSNILYQQILQFQISMCFVILITEDNVVKSNLELIHQNSISDEEIFDIIVANNVPSSLPKKNIEDNSKTICVLPWEELYIDPTSEVFLCCNAPKENIFVDAKNGYTDVLNKQAFRNVRLNMLAGKKTINCKKCYTLEEYGTESLRMRSNKLVGSSIEVIKKLSGETNSDGRIYNNPRRLVFGFRNTCNLKCVMCTGNSSSMIRKEEIDLFNKPYHSREFITPHEYKHKIQTLLPYIKDFEQIIFAGGEPLMIPEHYAIIDEIQKQEKYDMQLDYHTNLTLTTYKNIDIFAYWKKLSNLHIHLSMDASGIRGEYVRFGIKWDDIVKNYKKILSILPHAFFDIGTTISIFNAVNSLEFHKEWISSKLIMPTQLRVNVVIDPPFMSLQVLPHIYKQMISEKIKYHILFLEQYPDSHSLIKKWKTIDEFMHKKDNSYLLKELFIHIDRMDNYRNMFFDETFPEYADLRSYI